MQIRDHGQRNTNSSAHWRLRFGRDRISILGTIHCRKEQTLTRRCWKARTGPRRGEFGQRKTIRPNGSADSLAARSPCSVRARAWHRFEKQFFHYWRAPPATPHRSHVARVDRRGARWVGVDGEEYLLQHGGRRDLSRALDHLEVEVDHTMWRSH